MTTTTAAADPRTAALAVLPEAVRAVAVAHSGAVAGIDWDAVDVIELVAGVRHAQEAIRAAELELLAVAVLAGAAPTPACATAGIDPRVLRRVLAGAAA